MMQTNEHWESTRSALHLLEQCLASIYQNKDRVPLQWYVIQSEPYVDHIRELRARIDDYIGLNDAETAITSYYAQTEPNVEAEKRVENNVLETDEHWETTRAALQNLESALASIYRKKNTVPLQWYVIQIEPIVDHIHELHAQIDEYIGLNHAEKAIAEFYGDKEPETALAIGESTIATTH